MFAIRSIHKDVTVAFKPSNTGDQHTQNPRKQALTQQRLKHNNTQPSGILKNQAPSTIRRQINFTEKKKQKGGQEKEIENNLKVLLKIPHGSMPTCTEDFPKPM